MWTVLQARDPLRDLEQDYELKTALNRKLMGLAADGVTNLTTPSGYSTIKEFVTAAYREEIIQTKARLQRLGVEIEEAEAKAGEPG